MDGAKFKISILRMACKVHRVNNTHEILTISPYNIWIGLLPRQSGCPQREVFVLFYSVIAIEPGAVGTQFAASAFKSVFEPKDEETKALYDKMLNYMLSEWMREEALQTGDDIAEYILKAMTDEKPQVHYLTNKTFEGLQKLKYNDVTGKECLRDVMSHITS